MQSGDSLILLVRSLSLTLFNTAVLPFFLLSFHSHIFLSDSCACPPFGCYRPESGRPNPNGISSYTGVRGSFSLCSCRDLGQRSSREARRKGRNVGASKQYLGACEYVSVKVSGAQRQRRCPTSCRIRPNRERYFPRRGCARLPLTIDLFRHPDSIRDQSYMIRDRVVANSREGIIRKPQIFREAVRRERVLRNITGCRHRIVVAKLPG